MQFCFKASSFINTQTTTNTQADTNVKIQAEIIDKRITFVRDEVLTMLFLRGLVFREVMLCRWVRHYFNRPISICRKYAKTWVYFDKCIIQCVSFIAVLSTAAVTVRPGESRPSTRQSCQAAARGPMESGDTGVLHDCTLFLLTTNDV